MPKRKSAIGIESIISVILQVSVILSSLVIFAGLILFFAYSPQHIDSYQHLTTASYSFPHSIATLRKALQSGEGTAFIELGLLLLILTPVLRVAVSLLLFLQQRDSPMAMVTLCVLLVLICSFILGMAVG